MSDPRESVLAGTAPASQSKYQVRFDVGPGGLERIGDADVLIRVDALRVSARADGFPAGVAIAADLTNRTAAAAWVLEHQVRLGRRVSIAVVTAGQDGAFSSPDLLAAGAVIDALVSLGIDFTSPEAAVACAAFDSLKNAVGHLFTASVDGQVLSAAGRRDHVVASARVDTSDDVTVL